MKILVTAGNTMVPIDRVRGISNIFRGRTGTKIALEFCAFDHDVTLVTSSPDLVPASNNRLRLISYKTFDDLARIMEQQIRGGNFDLIVHSAAVSDYRPTGKVSVPADAGAVLGMQLPEGYSLIKEVPAGSKISSSHPTLFIETVQTIKLIDKIHEWGFKGFLVKFKLQVGITDGALIDIARKSRADSNANLIVANCLEWSNERAYVIGTDDVAHAVLRSDIPLAILRRMQ